MRLFTHLTRTCLLGACLIGFTGCEDIDKKTTTAKTDTEDHGDHDHDDHASHDHDGDDHAAHDAHAGHDHDAHAGHDHDAHAGHDHGDDAHQIDAKAAGLSTDDLVSLDEPPMPDNLNDAVKQLAKMSATIGDGFKNDKIDDAHGPLHDVANLLECIEGLAKESSLSDTDKDKASEAVEKLFDGYGAIDEKLHNEKKGKDYADVADSIDTAVKTLVSLTK